jgi:tRNA-specific 2-thiouridylase
VVGPREALLAYRILLRDMNWLGDEPLEDLPAGGLPLWARIRSMQPPQPATLFHQGGEISVLLRDGEHGVSPGQACVFYECGEPRARVLGGGWIARAV